MARRGILGVVSLVVLVLVGLTVSASYPSFGVLSAAGETSAPPIYAYDLPPHLAEAEQTEGGVEPRVSGSEVVDGDFRYAIRRAALAQFLAPQTAGSLDEAFHYTFDDAVESISRNGLRPGSYATPAGNLSPLQAQIDLALPPNRVPVERGLAVVVRFTQYDGWAWLTAWR